MRPADGEKGHHYPFPILSVDAARSPAPPTVLAHTLLPLTPHRHHPDASARARSRLPLAFALKADGFVFLTAPEGSAGIVLVVDERLPLIPVGI